MPEFPGIIPQSLRVFFPLLIDQVHKSPEYLGKVPIVHRDLFELPLNRQQNVPECIGKIPEVMQSSLVSNTCIYIQILPNQKMCHREFYCRALNNGKKVPQRS